MRAVAPAGLFEGLCVVLVSEYNVFVTVDAVPSSVVARTTT